MKEKRQPVTMLPNEEPKPELVSQKILTLGEKELARFHERTMVISGPLGKFSTQEAAALAWGIIRWADSLITQSGDQEDQVALKITMDLLVDMSTDNIPW